MKIGEIDVFVYLPDLCVETNGYIFTLILGITSLLQETP
jgi:hypothetical protein